MFEPIRGGTRGGQAEFKWSDVSADKDREHYLGHSINAPTGRWQKNKDVHWYNRDSKPTDEQKQEEIRKIKEAEEEALAAVLGYTPTKPDASSSVATGANATPSTLAIGPEHEEELAAKEAKRQRKLERKMKKAEKRAKEDRRRRGRSPGSDSEDPYSQRRHSHRSLERSRLHSRSRSHSPPRRRSPGDVTSKRGTHRGSPVRGRPRSPTPPIRRGSPPEYYAAERDRYRRSGDDIDSRQGGRRGRT